LTYPNDGLFTETRTVGDCSASLTIVVLETEQTDSIVVIPTEVTMPLGDTQLFLICPINQFGIAVDTCRETFRATQIGDTTVEFDCFTMTASALAHVLPYSAVNLALHKPTATSGYENVGTKPENATDGDLNTRWGSRFLDDEWLEVDLEHCYILDSMRIYWEAAYATSYEIFVSQDAITYESVYSTAAGKGGVVCFPITASGRYVKLVCHARSTGYGSSLYEMEVYGSGRCDSPETGLINDQSPMTNYKFLYNGQIYISRNGIIYTVDGRMCLHAQE